MKFAVGENGRNPGKNLPRPRFVHHETHMEGPRRELGTPAVGGERLTAWSRGSYKYIGLQYHMHSLEQFLYFLCKKIKAIIFKQKSTLNKLIDPSL